MASLLKMSILLSGIPIHALGLVLVFMDGVFHVTLNTQRLHTQSPDWVIAQQWQGVGFPLHIHHLLGWLLILGTISIVLTSASACCI